MSGVADVRGRVLGLDPGERRIGVAISDPLGMIAQPHSVIDRREEDPLGTVRNLVTEYDVSVIVVGLPISLSGREGPAADAARVFAGEVSETVDCEVELMDERFTTVTAEQALIEGKVRRDRRRVVRDKVAAAVMLQVYLDGRSMQS